MKATARKAGSHPETLDDYDFDLPKSLIAQHPVTIRDHCRLLIHHRNSGLNEHRRFYHLPEYLNEGDMVVFNETKVIPARCYFFKKTGGRIEIFLTRSLDPTRFEGLVRGKIKSGEVLSCKGIQILTEKPTRIGHWQFQSAFSVDKIMKTVGKIPLPPYIKRPRDQDPFQAKDQREYQTVFARNAGAIAAPTAGLHFTNRLLDELKSKGVELNSITLHVGVGTFQPITETDYRTHSMHEENYIIEPATREKLLQARADGRKILAVGTTTVRTLESAGPNLENPTGTTNLFVFPPYEFNWVKGLVTNFHLPRSSLLLLVSAMVGQKRLMNTYREAVERGYRFFSYGDGMLIL